MDQPSKFDPREPVPEGAKWKKRKPLSHLLRRYVVADNGCWEWTGTRNKQGYGVVGIAIDKRPIGIPAPRLQWMHHHGEIAKGEVIRHTCDNPPCINPDHLRSGSQADNMQDMISKNRDVRVRGEDHFRTTLTAGQVLAIKTDPRKGPAIAADYGVSATTVYNIKRGATWGHVGFLKVLS